MDAKIEYRIQLKDSKFKFAGTGVNSWFSLEEARKKVNYSNGERIVQCHPVHGVLWESF